jgi:protein-tyrosine phosphatase
MRPDAPQWKPITCDKPMNPPKPFTDIHCHLLPGLDDGASTLDEALAMAEMAVSDGIGTIVATPHQLGNHAQNSGETIRAAVDRFQQTLRQRRIPLRVLPGADVRIEPDLVRKIRIGEVLTLADRRRHILLELPHDVYVPLDRLLADLSAVGIVGILSHPERNRGIINQPGVLRPLVQRGCLLQVTAGSLTGVFGQQVQRFSESLVEQGLVHFISTDAHGTKARPPKLGDAFQRVVELVGRKTAEDLFCRNPEAVARGEKVTPGCRRQSEKSTLTGWLRRTFSSELVTAKPI